MFMQGRFLPALLFYSITLEYLKSLKSSQGTDTAREQGYQAKLLTRRGFPELSL